MADININKFRTSVVREGSRPASAGFVESEGQDPVDPAGSTQNHLPVTIAPAATALSITDSQVLGGAGTVAQYVRGDGSLADFPQSIGSGASVSYYLNGSVNQGTIGGVTYYEMNKTPIIGAGTDFTRNSNGYIASFLTDANDPALLVIPAGNWNFETYFEASSGGGSPTFYLELYKYDGTTFSLIASNSGSPKLINDGTSIEAYFSALAVPQTTLTLTDRLAIRIYVTTAGRTITLHTENGHLCQVITTFTTGLSALNGLTSQVQFFAVGTSGTNFNIASATDTHTFNLPTASATNRGALSSTDWSTFNNKQNQLNGTGFVKASGTTITYDNSTYQVTSEKGQPNGYASLDGNGKVPLAQINDALIGNVNYQGLWNAATNNPTLVNPPSSGTKGYYYIVSTAGTFASISFEVGDWIISNGSAWQKVDNTDAVSSVFGRTGNVIAANGDYNTSQVTENTNLYFTQARVSANTDVAANTAARHNAVTLGTANGLSLSTQQLSLQLASGSQNGALSSTDWSTFNSKENAITAGTTAQYFRGDKTFQTLNTGVVPESGNLYFTQARVSANTDVAANTAARHNAVTLGTANGLSLSTQQLSLGLASAGVTGALSGTDWSTFNSKQQALNGTGFVKISGTTISYDNSTYYLASNPSAFIALTALSGTAPIQYNNTTGAISITQASGSTNGFLSSTDWTTFNNKQAALNGTGFVKISGTTISYDNSTYLTTAAAASTYVPYTGATSGVDLGTYTLSASNLIANGGFNAGALLLKQSSNAQTIFLGYTAITPVGNNTLNFGFSTGSGVWKNFTLSSFLLTDNINRTYTLPDASGTIALVGGSGVGTVTSVAALTLGTSGTDLSSTVANSTTTPVITLNVPTASAANRGALSAADWTTFNNKQNALTNPVTGTGTTNYLPKFTGTSTIGNSVIQEASSNIGIGVSPSRKLHVLGGAGTAQIQSTGSSSIMYFGDASSSVIDNQGFGSLGNTLYLLAGGAERLYLSSSGNLGLGVTPSAWGLRGFDISNGSLFGDTNNVGLTQNAYYGSSWVYKNNGTAANYIVVGNEHRWNIAPSGTAGNAISFTQAMTLNASGNLMVGTTSAVGRLTVQQSTDATNGGISIFAVNGEGAIISRLNDGGLTFRNGGEERMRITSGGNVLIGTTTDAGFKLQVNGEGSFYQSATNSTAYLRVENNRSRNAALRLSTTVGDYLVGVGIGADVNQFQIYDNVAGATRLTISSTGAATFSNTVRVNGGELTVYSGSSVMYTGVDTGNNYVYFGTNTANYGISFQASGDRMRIFNDGNVSINNTSNAGFKLDVNGTGRFSGNLTGTTASFTSSSTLLTLTSGAGTKAVFATTRNFGVNRNFQIAVDEFSESAFTITPSTTIGGSTYTTPIFTLAAAGAATFSTSVAASSFTSQGGRGTGFGFRLPDWQIYNTSSGNGFAINNYSNDVLTLASTGAATFSSSVTATQFITGGTPSNTAGFTNSFYAHSNFPSITLSNTSTNTGKFTLGVTEGSFGIWNNTTNSYPFFINSSNNVLIGTTTDNSNKLRVNGTGWFDGNVLMGNSVNRFVGLGTGNSNAHISFTPTNDINFNGQSAALFQFTLNGVQIGRFNNAEVFGQSVRTTAPTGGSAENWKLGNAATGTVNANRLIRVEIAGVGYDLVARQII